MTLVKTTVLTGLSTFIKILSVFIINKVVAVYAGPSGLALIGQLQNFVALILSISNGSINNGVVKYTAEYKNQQQMSAKLFSTSIKICFGLSIILASVLFIFAEDFSKYFLYDNKYILIFKIFSFTLLFYSLNTILLSILNGLGEIKTFIVINIISSIFSLIFTSLLIVSFNIIGALIALVSNQAVIFFVTLLIVHRQKQLFFKDFLGKFDVLIFKKLSHFSMMAITTAVMTPFVLISIRNKISNDISLEAAGYWQGVWYISDMYLLVITTAIGVYLLPKFSAISDKAELKQEIFSAYKVLIPIVFTLALGIFLFKELIIQIVFSEEFIPMRELFLFQLIGDVLKIASWILSYLMLAKAMTKLFIATEIFFSLSFLVFSFLFLEWYGLVGVTYAFALNYFFYLSFLTIKFRRYLNE